MRRLGGNRYLIVFNQGFQCRRQYFPSVAPEAKLGEKFRLAAIVRVCRVKQIILDFLTADDRSLCVGKLHCATSVPEIHKLHRHGKFMGAHGGDDGLQFIAALAVHAHFAAVNLSAIL